MVDLPAPRLADQAQDLSPMRSSNETPETASILGRSPASGGRSSGRRTCFSRPCHLQDRRPGRRPSSAPGGSSAGASSTGPAPAPDPVSGRDAGRDTDTGTGRANAGSASSSRRWQADRTSPDGSSVGSTECCRPRWRPGSGGGTSSRTARTDADGRGTGDRCDRHPSTIEAGQAPDQPPGVGMAGGTAKTSSTASPLHHPTAVHHRQPIGHAGHHPEIVGDQHDPQFPLLPGWWPTRPGSGPGWSRPAPSSARRRSGRRARSTSPVRSWPAAGAHRRAHGGSCRSADGRDRGSTPGRAGRRPAPSDRPWPAVPDGPTGRPPTAGRW